jgi:Ca-activated chloride channel homolog
MRPGNKIRIAAALWTLLPCLFGFELMQSPNPAVDQGNAQMRAGKPEEALAQYDRAVRALPADPGVHFNRGAALFALSRYDEATAEFLRATEAKAPSLKASAFYNLGNSQFKANKFGDAVAAYKRALALEPGDIRSKWNLELALKKKKEEDEKKDSKDDQKNDQKKDKKDDKSDKPEDQKQDPQKDEQNQDKQPPKPDNQEQKPEKKSDDAKKQEPEPKPAEEENNPAAGEQPEKAPDMKEIEAILDGLERSPKELEKVRARLRAIRRAPPAKDW